MLAGLGATGCGDDGTGGSESATDSVTGGISTTGTIGTDGPTTEGPPTTVPTGTDGPTGGMSMGDTQGTTAGTVDPTPGTVGTDSTDATTDAVTATDSDTVGETTDGEDLCEGGTLCGQPAVCCPAGNECIDDQCLPLCDSGVYCGPDLQCCDGGQVCSGAACVTPGALCKDSYDCAEGEYCEVVLGQCLPQPDPLECELVPEFDELNVIPEWEWKLEEVLSSPAVADLDGDGTPEVVINTTKYKVNDFTVGIIIVLDGAKGSEKFRVEHEPANMKFGSHGRSTVGVGDVSGDGLPDIVYAGRSVGGKSTIYAIDHTGALLWSSHTANNQPATTGVENGGATLANFDDDPEAEIVFGATLIDNDGTMVWNLNNNGGLVGAPADYGGGLSAVVDVTGDGYPEIVTGKQAWQVAWTPGNPPTVMVTQLWVNNSGNGSDGWPAIADLDQNGSPEVVLAAAGQVRVLDGATGLLWCGVDPTGVMCEGNNALRTQPIALPGGGRGGPPTVADFDGDGRPETAVAGSTRYTVFDFNREGEEIVQPNGDAMPVAGAIYRRWSAVTQDASSNVTGSSVFDFQGDGAAEVTYNDECYARVYSGTDGTELLKIPNSSATIHEYPLVVDADADGNSEILMVANLGGCGNNQNYMQRKGVYLYGDAGDGWVPTRKVWTQHTYHVTNAGSDGNVPMQESDNWTTPGLNNYRQNSQGAGVFNAADLTVDLSIGLGFCAEQLELIATVRNEGASGVPAGIVVEFYEGQDATGTLLATVMTEEPLLPGGSTKVKLLVDAPPGDQTADYYVEVDEASKGDGAVLECNEDNNSDLTTAAACPSPG